MTKFSDYRENLLLHYNKLFNLHECKVEDSSSYKYHSFILETEEELRREYYEVRIVQYYKLNKPMILICELNENVWSNLDNTKYFNVLDIEKIKKSIIRQSDYQILDTKRGMIYG